MGTGQGMHPTAKFIDIDVDALGMMIGKNEYELRWEPRRPRHPATLRAQPRHKPCSSTDAPSNDGVFPAGV